jgi:hypothetical protein
MNAIFQIAGHEEKLMGSLAIRSRWMDIRQSNVMTAFTVPDKMRRRGCGYEDDV